MHLRKLDWKHWGARKTRAKGEYAEPMNIEDPWLDVRVKLSKPVEHCGRTVYSKASFETSGYGGLDFKLWTC